MLNRLRSLPDHWPWLATVMRVQERFNEVRGGEMASAITLAAFFSIFPLLLVTIAVVGYFSVSAGNLPAQVISRFGLTGEAATVVTSAIAKAESSRKTASVIGLVGLLWSGLGLVAVLQSAYNSVWQVKGRGWKDKLVGLGWLAGAGVIFAASFAITAALGVLPGFVAPVGIAVAFTVDVALFIWSSSVLPNRDVPWRALLPGAILGAVGLEALKALGTLYVPHAVSSASALYGSIGVVFALLAWLFFFARLVVYASVLNVVRWETDHGTITVEVDAPRLPNRVALEADRSGQVMVQATTPAAEQETVPTGR